MQDTPLIVVPDAEALDEVLAQLANEPVLGIDTEADSMHRYREKVCLIQISGLHADYILDPLAGYSLEPLGPILANPDVVKIFHGADYDVVSLKRDFGFEIRNLFDTMIAAQLIEMPRVGLADLVYEYFGEKLDKKFQTHDWARRPLYDEHLQYARGDTHFLLAIREVFNRRLKRMGRLEIATEEFAILEDRVWKPRAPAGSEFLKIKQASKLGESELRVLRALWNMRDKHAERLDRPSYKVVPDQVLIKLAQSQPESLNALGKQLRPGSTMVKRYGQEMVDAIAAGLETTDTLPKLPKTTRVGTPSRHGARDNERLMSLLKQWRVSVLKRDQVPPVMVASNAQLKGVAGYRPTTLEELSGMIEIRDWQVSRYGDELLTLISDFEANRATSIGSSDGGGGGGGRKRKRRRRKRTSEDAAK
jgi:ribonuclease D